MRILLADPPQKEEYYELISPTIGILYLIGYLTKKYQDLDIYYLEGACNLKEHLKKVNEYKPDIYGISFTTPVASLAYKTIDTVKKRNPNLPIICGGSHPTAIPEEVFQRSKADICVLGEGEETFLELVDYYLNGKKDIKDINGIAFKEENEIIKTPKRSLIKDLDSIPFPAWDSIDLKKYSGYQYRKSSPFASVLVSRGCPFDCIFCSNPVWKHNKPWVRPRSPNNIVEEITYLYDKGIREIRLNCDEFNPNLNWAIEVCQEIEKLKFKDLYFSCPFRVDKVSDELVQLFSKINLWLVSIGIESGNQRTLDGIKKKITLEQIISACKLFKRKGIKVYGYVMLYNTWEEGGKLCWENEDEVRNTLKFCHKLYRDKLLDYMSWQIATPIIGAKLWEIAQKYNLLLSNFEIKSRSFTWEPSMNLPGISPKRIKKDLRKGMLMKDYYLFRSGNIDWRHSWGRILRNLKKIVSP